MSSSAALLTDSVLALCALAREAGQAILQVYATNFSQHMKSDSSPVTQADWAADRVIVEGLAQLFPGVWVWSEESGGPPPVGCKRFFLVDPLDGTKEFIRRSGEFTVNIALIEEGMPVFGVVYAPVDRELFVAQQGLGSFYWNDGALSPILLLPCPVEKERCLRILGSRSHGNPLLQGWLERLNRPYELKVLGSSLKFCRVVQGQAEAYVRFGPTSQWDTAAGHALVLGIGLEVTDMAGCPLRYGVFRDVLNPDFVVKRFD